MFRRQAIFVFAAGASALACDTASVYEQCSAEDKVGTGEARCPKSAFRAEDQLARSVAGFLSAGTEHVSGALVHVDGVDTTTDREGLFRVPSAPFRYDVTARFERDVVTYRDVANRFLDIAIDRQPPIPSWSGGVRLTLDPPPRPGDALSFLVKGARAVTVTGSLEEGLVVWTRDFETDVRLYAIEYPEAVGFAGAVASGGVDLRIKSGASIPATIALVPIGLTQPTTFTAQLPGGFVPGECELLYDFGVITSQAAARPVPLGTRVDLPIIPDGGWVVRLRATRADGAVVTTRNLPFPPAESVPIELLEPPEALEPLSGMPVVAGTLRARGEGVLEHLLEPEAGGPTIHVVTSANDAVVPDLTEIALPRAGGRYVWTVRSFPDLTFVDSLSGYGARVLHRVSESAPRTIVLP